MQEQLPVVVDPCCRIVGAVFAEREHARLGGDLFKLFGDNRVLFPENERIGRGEVLQDAELGIYIVLHLVFIAVEVVGGDVHQHSDVGTEIIHVLQLERAEFHNIDVVFVFGDLPCQRTSYIACKPCVDACLAQDMVNQHSRGGLAVRPGYTHHFGIAVAAGEFDFRNNRDATLFKFLDDRGRGGYARRFHHLVGIQNQLFGVMPLFVGDFISVESFKIAGRYFSAVA